MNAVTDETSQPDVSFDGGDLDCGNGLLLLIRKHIDPLPRGGLLEIRSTEISVDEDLPAWCNDRFLWKSAPGRPRRSAAADSVGAGIPQRGRTPCAPLGWRRIREAEI